MSKIFIYRNKETITNVVDHTEQMKDLTDEQVDEKVKEWNKQNDRTVEQLKQNEDIVLYLLSQRHI